VISSFARHYRPQTFQDLLGQDPLVLTLKGGIESSRIVRALILSGIRGTGKTTSARIYAKALNCDQGLSPTPCGLCESCVAIRDGYHEDVVEIDGASHTGVEDIRRLKENSQYVCQRSRFKIYIIDEVHMLSTSAFNALLKILEEPPEHVIFIFATTELHKIPETIQSRCQIFMLNKIPTQTIAQHLKSILEKESIPYAESAIKRIAKKAQGSMRDALTLMEQLVLLGQGRLDDSSFSSSYDDFKSLILSLLERDKIQSIQICEKLTAQGQDVHDLLEELCEYVHFAMLFKETGRTPLEEELTSLQAIAAKATPTDLNRLFRVLLQCTQDLIGSDMDIYICQNALLEWCLDPGIAPQRQIVPKPHRQAAEAVPVQAPESTVAPAPVESKTPTVEYIPGVFPPSWADLVAQWRKKRPMQALLLEDTYVERYTPECIVLSVKKDSMAAGKLLDRSIRERITAELKTLFAFTGYLEVHVKTGDDLSGQESVLEQRQDGKAKREAQLREEALNHPMTQELINKLDAKVLSIEIDDRS
jgi:DNA polymerase III subunit gamma/tau